MSNMFPTKLAMSIAAKAGIDKLLARPIDLTEAMQDFQKVSTVCDFDDAIVMLEAHIVSGELSEEHRGALQRIYDFTDIEVDGFIVDRLGGIIREAKVEANSLSAATILNKIRNGEEADPTKGDIRRVIFELDRDD